MFQFQTEQQGLACYEYNIPNTIFPRLLKKGTAFLLHFASLPSHEKIFECKYNEHNSVIFH